MVTVGYSRLPSGYSGLQPVTADYREGGYNRLTAGYRVVTVGFSMLQQVTAGY